MSLRIFMKHSDERFSVRRAFLDTVPVMMGYLVLGIGFGVILKTKGYGFFWCFAMSAFIYAGSMQYVAIDLLSGGAGLITAALTTLLVNARHLFYGISMVERYRQAGKKKAYLIFALTDETYSLVCSREPGEEREAYRRYCFFVSLFDQIYWVSGSLLGTLLASLLSFNTQGIDFALTALFVTVFVEQWLGSKDHSSAIIGLGASTLSLLLFGPEKFLLPAMLLITLLLLRCGRISGGEDHA